MKFSAPVQTGSGAHPTFRTMGTRSLSRGYSGRGMAPNLIKGYRYTSTPPLALTAHNRVNFIPFSILLVLPFSPK